jgi:hypothetical protein
VLVLGSSGPCYLFPEHREGVSGCLRDIVRRLPIVLSRHVQLRSRSIDLNVEHQLPVMAADVCFAMSSVATSLLPTFSEEAGVAVTVFDLHSGCARFESRPEIFRSYPQFLQTNSGIVLPVSSKSFAIDLSS